MKVTFKGLKIGVSVAIFSIGYSQSTSAYSLSEHRKMTEQAIEETLYCFPGFAPFKERRRMARASVTEDTNLLRKWLKFSHYYHPKKELPLFRRTSMDRVQEIQKRFGESISSQTFSDIGHAAHHMQDLTAPPHVVPVRHALSDSFEGFELKAIEWPPFNQDCAFFDDGIRSPDELLHKIAIETLSLLDHPIEVQVNRKPQTLTWEAFWQERDGKKFGRYGELGDRFGKSQIRIRSDHYEIPRRTYSQFKAWRVQRAIDATKELIAWVLL